MTRKTLDDSKRAFIGKPGMTQENDKKRREGKRERGASRTLPLSLSLYLSPSLSLALCWGGEALEGGGKEESAIDGGRARVRDGDEERESGRVGERRGGKVKRKDIDR